jgi:ABC-type uncharacterized transport system permease subunit
MLTTLAITGYLAAIVLQYLQMLARHSIQSWLIVGITWVALLTHAYLLYRWIDIGIGQNLYFLNVLSLVSWLVALLVALFAWKKPAKSLSIVVFPIAAISILLVISFPGSFVLHTSAHPAQLFHILCSMLAFSILCLAALQAILLAVQDQCLRHKQAQTLLQVLPPLEVMESLLFEMISLGFVLLSVVIFSSLVFLYSLGGATNTHSPYLAIVSWLIFAILLGGRHFLGWRGRVAIRWTLIGVLLLVVSYFGHWLIRSM